MQPIATDGVAYTLAPPGEYEWTSHVQRWCGLISNYFDHFTGINSGWARSPKRRPLGQMGQAS